MSLDDVNVFLADLRRALYTLENLPVPTIAAIDGPALGGGLELSLACDIRIAGLSVTKMGLPEVRLGIIPGAGGTQRAVRLLGLSKAKDLIFSGRTLTSLQAKDLGTFLRHSTYSLCIKCVCMCNAGLVDYVPSDGTAFERALCLGEEISAAGE